MSIKYYYYVASGLFLFISLFLPSIGRYNGYTYFIIGPALIILNPLLFIFWSSNVFILISFVNIEVRKYKRGLIYSLIGNILALGFCCVWPYMDQSGVGNSGLHLGYWIWLLSLFIFFCGSLHIYYYHRKTKSKISN